MQLATEVFGSVVVAHTPEDISGDNAELLEQNLAVLERANVIVDLDGTETFDSAGLEALLNAQESLRQVDGDLKISSTNSINRKLLEITRLDQQLEVFESVIDAVKSFV